MRKILVAGAGHGGLVAAYHLAKAGYDVTVIEAKKREDMGHDWHDWMYLDAFDKAGLPRPDDDILYEPEDQCYRNPRGDKKVELARSEGSVMMDRKELLAYLISLAEENGVKLEFEAEIVAPLTDDAAVKGIIIRKDGALYERTAELVIDSAGMYSPVRTKLPGFFGIENKINKRSIFHVYRAYFENTTGEESDYAYTINMFHMYRPGIDWTVVKKDYVDVLIGKFSQAGELTQGEIDAALASFKQDYPFIGEKILRGGCKADIPISRMLPMIVADGYAAIGDSAGMTVPLNGSGIVLSLAAGKILADTVIGIEGEITRAALWAYEYNYFTQYGKDLVAIDIIKNLFTYVKGDVVDYLFDKGILNADMIGIADGRTPNIDADYIKKVVSAVPQFVKLIPAAAKSIKTLPLASAVCGSIPKEYNVNKINKWIKAYKAL
jgi:flavin-dependent dehydrogenase